MSQLEESAKPLLLRGFDAETFTLTPKDQGLLSRWACMKAMVAEQSEPDLATTPAIDRLAFHDTQVPPFYFRVTLGVHVTSSQTWFLRRTMTLSFSPTVQPPLVDGLEKNTQLLTFIVGRLVFQVLSARVQNFRLFHDVPLSNLAVIHPSFPLPLASDKLKQLGTEELRSAVFALDACVARLKARHVEHVI